MPTHLAAAIILASAFLLQPLAPGAMPGLPVARSAGDPAVPAASWQQPRLALLPESRVWVDGTSNKNDWTVKATSVSGFVHLSVEGDALELGGGSFTVLAKQLASEHGVIMDRLMQNALKSGVHPNIVYELAGATVTGGDNGKYAVATQGRVTIAGVTKDVAQTVNAERLPNGTIRFTGSQPVLMSEYGMTPPTAMFGALRTANRVVVNFELVVKP
jgi:polyisoprenoid-binding protein YceI